MAGARVVVAAVLRGDERGDELLDQVLLVTALVGLVDDGLVRTWEINDHVAIAVFVEEVLLASVVLDELAPNDEPVGERAAGRPVRHFGNLLLDEAQLFVVPLTRSLSSPIELPRSCPKPHLRTRSSTARHARGRNGR